MWNLFETLVIWTSELLFGNTCYMYKCITYIYINTCYTCIYKCIISMCIFPTLEFNLDLADCRILQSVVAFCLLEAVYLFITKLTLIFIMTVDLDMTLKWYIDNKVTFNLEMISFLGNRLTKTHGILLWPTYYLRDVQDSIFISFFFLLMFSNANKCEMCVFSISPSSADQGHSPFPSPSSWCYSTCKSCDWLYSSAHRQCGCTCSLFTFTYVFTRCCAGVSYFNTLRQYRLMVKMYVMDFSCFLVVVVAVSLSVLNPQVHP